MPTGKAVVHSLSVDQHIRNALTVGLYDHLSDTLRMLHTTNDGVVMAMAKNMENVLNHDPEAAMDIFSFMRPIADDTVKNMYSNLQSASLYMSKTQQMAKIIPSPVRCLDPKEQS